MTGYHVLIHSNAPWCGSGYGKQCAQLALGLRAAGHEVTVSAFHGLQGTPLNWHGLTVLPGSQEDQWGHDILPAHYARTGSELLITLMDAWVLDPSRLRGMNMAHWMPVDCTPLGAMDKRCLVNGGGRPIAMSEFGANQLREAGFDPLYVPHGIDTDVYAPLASRDDIREELGMTGRFVAGIAAANQDPMRKGFSESLTAWAVFARAHPDALLLVHTRAETRQGVPLAPLIRELGIPEDQIRFGDQYYIAAGTIGDAEMARWYAVTDVVVNAAFGEGFGLHPLEAQSCGTPVIVTDCSAMSELCGAGWKIRVDHLRDAYWNRGHEAWWVRPSPPEIVRCLEKAHAAWSAGKLGPMRKRARSFALRYSADRVLADSWEPALKTLMSEPGPAG